MLTALLLGVLVYNIISQDSVHRIELTLTQQAYLLSEISKPVLSDKSHYDISSTLADLGRKTKTRYTVIDADGIVIADSHEDHAVMENHIHRPEVVQSREDGIGTSTRYSQTLGQQMMYLSVCVKDSENILGYVRTSLPLPSISDRMASIRGAVLLGIAITLLVSLPLGLLMARKVVRPLVEMSHAAQAITEGDYSQRISVDSHDEVADLANSLNQMSDSLKERLETISRDRNQFEAILSSMVEGVIAVDSNERIVHVNRVAASLCPEETDAIKGKRVWEAFRIPKLTEVIKAANDTGQFLLDELIIPSPSGMQEDRTIAIGATPWRNGSSEIVGTVLVLHDITNLRQYEKMRQEFIANASHELKSPVTAIQGMSETLLEVDSMDTDTQRRFLTGIHDESRRLALILKDMLTLSQAEQERDRLAKKTVDINDIIREASTNHLNKANMKDIEIAVNPTTEPLTVNGNFEQLVVAIGNLVDNAINYTPPGGRVEVCSKQNKNQCTVTVKDNGIGIASEHHERIFERFYRADKARSRELGGTGLGLAIVKHIILAHDGTISVSSAPNLGSEFIVKLDLFSD